MMNKILLFLSFVFVLFLSSANAQSNHIVDVSSDVFTPSSITITLGDTVTWKWISGTHTTTSDSTTGMNTWDAPIDVNHQTFSFVITSPGLHAYHCKFHASLGMTGTINVVEPTEVKNNFSLPKNYSLSQNYPNPFNPTTTVKYSLPTSSLVKVKVFNSVGNQVATLVNEQEQAGYYRISFDGKDFSSGVYFLQFEANNFLRVEKMILLK